MKNILITGAAGFIGFHLAKYYSEQDYNIWTLDNLQKNENFLDLRNKYNISYFIGCSTTALYEACLYDALPIILKNNSSIAKEIISEGIIKSAKNDYKNISKILKHPPNKKELREQKKKIWGEIKYNKSLIINNIK